MNHDHSQEEVSSGAYKQRTEDRLAVGGFLLLLLVGGPLTWLLLGVGPATMAVVVILLVATLLLALYKGLALLEAWLKRD